MPRKAKAEKRPVRKPRPSDKALQVSDEQEGPFTDPAIDDGDEERDEPSTVGT
jgi:hypothetical protein